MKRLTAKSSKMTIVYTGEPMPEKLTKSIYLAGPCLAPNKRGKSWRTKFLALLEEKKYDGVVFVPEYNPNTEIKGEITGQSYTKQVEWEHKCIEACDALVFWVDRHFTPDNSQLALTTNIEFGLYFNSGKIFVGAPDDAVKTEYMQEICKNVYTWHNNMNKLVNDVIAYLNKA